jgi:hypothetical protein
MILVSSRLQVLHARLCPQTSLPFQLPKLVSVHFTPSVHLPQSWAWGTRFVFISMSLHCLHRRIRTIEPEFLTCSLQAPQLCQSRHRLGCPTLLHEPHAGMLVLVTADESLDVLSRVVVSGRSVPHVRAGDDLRLWMEVALQDLC